MPDTDAYVTKTGRTLTQADIAALADEAEKGYDPARLRPRGRPRMGSGVAEVVPVRLDPEMRQAVQERAASDHTSVSEVVREALRTHLQEPA